jgi:hypothetical protein
MNIRQPNNQIKSVSQTSLAHPPATKLTVSEPAFGTFDQLIFDSLMPWLPVNNNQYLHEALLDSINFQQGNLFTAFIIACKKLAIPLPQPLIQEWKAISDLPEDLKMQLFGNIFNHPVEYNARLRVYNLLIRHSLVMMVQTFTIAYHAAKSKDQQKTLVSGTLRKISVWEYALSGNLRHYPGDTAIICRIWVAIRSFMVYLNASFYGRFDDIRIPEISTNTCLKGMESWVNEPDLTGVFATFIRFVKNQDSQLNRRYSDNVIKSVPSRSPAQASQVKSSSENQGSDQEGWISTKELTIHLKIGKSKINELSNIQGFPYSQISRNKRYKLSEVEAWLAAHPENIRYCIKAQNQELNNQA